MALHAHKHLMAVYAGHSIHSHTYWTADARFTYVDVQRAKL